MKKKVLFLCTANSARSQMAEAFLRHHAGDEFEALSAGVKPRPIHPLAIQVMAERRIDMREQTPKSLSQFLGKVTVHHAVFLCEEAELACPRLWPGALERLFWRFEDPTALEGSEHEQLRGFRAVRDGIEQQLLRWLYEGRSS
jgi:arsenate reductase